MQHPTGAPEDGARLPRPITLVSCCREKGGSIAPARELYRSQLFRKSATWADRQGHDWFVLSAKHGLIKPDDRLAPYDHSVRNMTPYDRQYWANAVAEQLRALALFWGVEHLNVTLLAGAAYANWIPLVEDWCTVRQPLEGLQIGQRLQWLTFQLNQYELDLEAA